MCYLMAELRPDEDWDRVGNLDVYTDVLVVGFSSLVSEADDLSMLKMLMSEEFTLMSLYGDWSSSPSSRLVSSPPPLEDA